jgi:hypothetical protein
VQLPIFSVNKLRKGISLRICLTRNPHHMQIHILSLAYIENIDGQLLKVG